MVSGCLVIAEAGVNHNGSTDLALDLIDAAAKAGADAVKFQTFKADRLAVRGAGTVEYQRRLTGQTDQHAMLRALELPQQTYAVLARRCEETGIEFMSTPFDLESAHMLVDLGMRRIKVPSGELTNLPLVRGLAGFGLPMIVSTGMATLDEVLVTVDVVRTAAPALLRDGGLTLLHCTSNYPTPLEDVNLRAMDTMRAATGLPVGYSDHTKGILVPVAAAALGATVVEKHFTLDRTMAGPDHPASLEPDELTEMVRSIRAVTAALGTGEKSPRPAEDPIRAAVRRSIVVARPIAQGGAIAEADLVLLRPGTGLPPAELERVIGTRARRDLPEGHLLGWDDVER